MPYTVHQAKTHFSRLLKEAEAGQEVIVMRGKKPVAKLVPIDPPAEEEGVRLPMAAVLAVCAVFTIFAGVSSPIIDFARHATTFV